MHLFHFHKKQCFILIQNGARFSGYGFAFYACSAWGRGLTEWISYSLTLNPFILFFQDKESSLWQGICRGEGMTIGSVIVHHPEAKTWLSSGRAMFWRCKIPEYWKQENISERIHNYSQLSTWCICACSFRKFRVWETRDLGSEIDTQ